jgi:hypothetical protein
VHLDFVVADLDAKVARLTATLDRGIQSRDYGRMANMADPFGNGFDLIEFSGPGYDRSICDWPVRETKLRRLTHPMDPRTAPLYVPRENREHVTNAHCIVL